MERATGVNPSGGAPSHAEVQPIVPPPRRAHYALLATLLSLFVAYGSFVPLEPRELSWDRAVELFQQRLSQGTTVFTLTDAGVNFMLFLPLGYLWLGVVDIDRRSRIAALLLTPLVLALLAGWSTAIEFTQLWFPRRTLSTYDIAAQIAGAATGVTLWWLVGRRINTAMRQVTAPAGDVTGGGTGGVTPLKRLLQLYALGLALYALQPFDLALSFDLIAAKFTCADPSRIGCVYLRPFSHTYDGITDLLWQVGVDAILFVPIGIMCRLKAGGRRTVLGATLLAAGLAVLLEAAQVLIYSRYADSTDVITETCGALLGALMVGWFNLDQPRARAAGAAPGEPSNRLMPALILAHVYAIPLLIVYLTPFHPVTSAQVFLEKVYALKTAPFQAYYHGSPFAALSAMLRGFMLFVPVGALTRWGVPLWSKWAGIGLVVQFGLGLGLMIELFQAATVNHHADLTDVLIYTLGALAGYWLWGIVAQEPATGKA